MEVGSDLFNILVTIGFIFFVLIVSYIIYLVYQANRLKYEFLRVKNISFFQVIIPQEAPEKEGEQPKNFQETIAVAEQFFASLGNLYEGSLEKRFYKLQNQISLEIIAHEGRLEFFVFCPQEIESILEKQINSYWPTAQIQKKKVPNIFKSRKGAMIVSELQLAKKFVLPIRTYKYLDSDPLNSLTNVLSKLGPESGAAIQLIVQPITDEWQRVANQKAQKVLEGKSIVSEKWYFKIFTFLFEALSSLFHGVSQKPSERIPQEERQVKLTPIQEQTLKAINEKVSKRGLEANLRIIVTAPSNQEAEMNLKNITTSFGQFSAPEVNSFKIKKKSGKAIRDYILRRLSGKGMILNTEELASIFHFPSIYVKTPNIEWLKAKELPPPTNLPKEGIVLGESIYRGVKNLVHLKQEDRRRHIFMIGKTGVGKTTLFSNMFEQDMREGKGCCFVDPLGDAIEDLLGKVPENRIKDVILFDPSDTEWPVGLNLLEFQTPDQKDFLIQEAIQIFYKLFDPTQMGIVGPQWEHWFRNAALTVMSQPNGGTIIDVPRIFTDDNFRNKLISYVQDPVVRSFWTKQLAKTADFHKSEMYNYFISKFGRFMTNDLIRNIIGQKKSSFDFRQAMDEGKIILVNLSKGKIGEVNSNLLGMIIVSKIQMSAFSRADIPEEQRRDFYLYVDEFQNFTTDSFATILSEARKYHLNLAVTNQYIAQLTETIRDAVIGNVGTEIVYRIGAADAEFMAKEFPGATIEDLSNLDRYNTYTKLLIDGTPSKPFSMKGLKSEVPSNQQIREQVRNYFRQQSCRPRAEIEKEIQAEIQSMENQPPAGANESTRNI